MTELQILNILRQKGINVPDGVATLDESSRLMSQADLAKGIVVMANMLHKTP